MRSSCSAAFIGACAILSASTIQARDDAVVVALADVDASDLEALKRTPGTRWWIEAGEVLLLAGDTARIRQHVPARQTLDELRSLAPDELALHARGCGDNTTIIDDSLILLNLGSYDLVRRPRSFSPLGDIVMPASVRALGAPEWLPVEANSTLARLHRFDRSGGHPPADPGIVPIVERVDGERWYDAVVQLASWDRSSWSSELTTSRQWVASEFASLGLTISEPSFTFTYNTHPANVANVIGHLEGHSLPDEWIVVGAHLDSRNTNNSPSGATNTPGADDNASGCAGVLEMARVLVNFRPAKSILFMCYSGEEQGLRGSYDHVADLSSSGDLGRIQAMLNLDMIGWVSPTDPTLGINLGTRTDMGNAAANQALMTQIADAAGTYVPGLQVITGLNTCCSDHMPYLEAGLPAVHSIHRGGAAAYGGWHHTQFPDTPANLGVLSQAIGAAIIRANIAVAAQLSGASDLIFADNNEL